MNAKEYIETGILEAYVLGALTPAERQQLETEILIYPEMQQELSEIEAALFRYCNSFAVTPPVGLQDKIWTAIQNPPVANAGNIESVAPKTSKTIPLNTNYRKSTFSMRNAAALALLIASLAVNYIFWNQGQHERDEKTALSAQMAKMQVDQKQLADQLSSYQSSKAMMADTGVQTIVMHTMVKGHPMAATLYWSKDKGDAYVAMDALPAPPEGMQYQLWVIQNGKPVSMGTLANDMANSPVMQKVAMSVTSGEAFAISLEKRGGNPTPTTVYVLGKV